MPSKALSTWPGDLDISVKMNHIQAGLLWYRLPFRACNNIFSPNNGSKHYHLSPSIQNLL